MSQSRELYKDAHKFFIFVKNEECSPKNHESTRRTEVGVHWLKYQSVHSCYSFAEKWSSRTRINESFQHLYPVTAWMKKLLQKARVTAATWHREVHKTILFFVLKVASEEHNVIRVLCGDIDCRLPAPVRVQN